MRRAQIEIMGLIIIVILVTIGMFFSVAFQKNEKTEITQVFTDERLSGDFLITFLSTDAKDCNAKMRDLARDAVLQQMNRSTYFCAGNYSQEYFNNTLDSIVNNTLYLWGNDYEINYTYTYAGESIPLYYRREGCSPTQERNAPGFQAIHLYPDAPGTALMTLTLCN